MKRGRKRVKSEGGRGGNRRKIKEGGKEERAVRVGKMQYNKERRQLFEKGRMKEIGRKGEKGETQKREKEAGK